jgi:hypothetical protein
MSLPKQHTTDTSEEYPSTDFESAIPAKSRLQIRFLHGTATAIG